MPTSNVGAGSTNARNFSHESNQQTSFTQTLISLASSASETSLLRTSLWRDDISFTQQTQRAHAPSFAPTKMSGNTSDGHFAACAPLTGEMPHLIPPGIRRG